MIIRGSVETVPSGVETTVLTYTNSGITRYIRNIGLEGNAESHWFVYKNLEVIFQRRLTAANITEEVQMFNISLAPGDILDVKVISYGPLLCEFSADTTITDTKEDLNITVSTNEVILVKTLNGQIKNTQVINGLLSNTSTLNGRVINTQTLNGAVVLKNQLSGIIQNRLRLNGVIRCK